MDELKAEDLFGLEKAVFSKASAHASWEKIIVKVTGQPNEFFAEQFKGAQVFHRRMKFDELWNFVEQGAPNEFRQIEFFTTERHIVLLTNKKGKTTVLNKPAKPAQPNVPPQSAPTTTRETLDTPRTSPLNTLTHAPHLLPQNREKNYILKPGTPLLFLQKLGIMTETGAVHAAKYDKFRQINRFLEYCTDVLPALTADDASANSAQPFAPLSIIDFGCGKAYLTFALYYYLSELRHIPCKILGIDLKKDVIAACSALATECGFGGLSFECGDIARYRTMHPTAAVDLVVTLHACDTATDYALAFAVEHGAKAILSVPCCQHELNTATGKHAGDGAFDDFLRYGIVKERFCALATDVSRADILEQYGYRVQLLEFIDMEGTPKNLLIRAVRKAAQKPGSLQTPTVCKQLEVRLTLEKLLGNF